MKIPTIVTVLLLSICPAFGDQPSLLITDQGYFFLAIEDGIPVIHQPSRVIDVRKGTPDEPVPSPVPPTSPTSPDPALTSKSKDWAKAVNDPNSAQALALIYRQIEESVKANTLTVDTGTQALSVATDTVLKSLETEDKWISFRDSASKELANRMSQGGMNTTQFAEFLLAIAFGLELASDGSNALSFSEVLEIVSKTNTAIDKTKQ